MGTTRQIPENDWQAFFEAFTRQHLMADPPSTATIEVVSPSQGDQVAASTSRLLGLSYDPRSQVFEVMVEQLDHLLFHPREIWVIEDESGFIPTMELVRSDGGQELIHLNRSGPPSIPYGSPSQTQNVDQPSGQG